VILFNDGYISDSNEVWIIWLWIGEFFDDDDSLGYIFEMMNCICWVD